MDELVTLSGRMARMSIRMTSRRLATVAQLCDTLGYTTPTSPPSVSGLPASTPPPFTEDDKRAAYRRQVRIRDLCSHETGKPYQIQGYMWMVCKDCNRRWRSEPISSGGSRWVVDDKDDPDRRKVSQPASSSQSAPSSRQNLRQPQTSAAPSTTPAAASRRVTEHRLDTGSETDLSDWNQP